MDYSIGPGGYDKVSGGDLRFCHGINIPYVLNWKDFLSDGPGSKRFRVIVTAKYLDKLPPMPNTIILGNMCYSGWSQVGEYKAPQRGKAVVDHPIKTAFTNRQLISYYSYGYGNGMSDPVDNNFCKKMEDSLVRALVVDGDSTGNAYLNSAGAEYTAAQLGEKISPTMPLIHSGHDDYSYEGCVTEFIDERDGQKYKAVCIGKQNWMAENLRFVAPGSQCYESSQANCDIYGRLYPWRVAMGTGTATNANPSGVQGICPKGWHLPSEAEWDELFTFLGGRDKAGNAMKLKSPLWKSYSGENNSSGFTGIPAGIFGWEGHLPDPDISYALKGEMALFLSTTVVDGMVRGLSLQHMSQKICHKKLYRLPRPARSIRTSHHLTRRAGVSRINNLMKLLKLLSLFALSFLLSHCGTTESVTPQGQPSLAEVESILALAQTQFLAFADSSGGDPHRAIERTMEYLFFEPNVADIYSIDSTYIRIILTSGLQTTFYFTEVDAAGNSLFRGGPGGNHLKDLMPLSKNTITNKKVLFFAADTKTLPAINPQIQLGLEKINASGLDLEVTVLRDEQCTYGVVETFKDYGLVLMDTHGEIDNFRVGSTLDLSAIPTATDEAIKAAAVTQLSAAGYDKLMKGELIMGAEIKGNPQDPNWHKSVIPSEGRTIHFSSKYVNLLPQMPNTIIFGNMCYSGTVVDKFIQPKQVFVSDKGKIVTRPERSMTVEGVGKAFINRNPISYYGYTRDLPYAGSSRQVPDEFAASCENSLIIRLISEKDSTGIAHTSHVVNQEFFDPEHAPSLKGDLYFRQYGHKDYSYEECVEEFTDERDGQKYKAVCIGKQNWMAENLRFVAPGSECYDSSQANCDIYGRLYPWRVAMGTSNATNANPSGVQGICPKGWHLPSQAEWDELFTFLGGRSKAGNAMKLKSPLWKSYSGETNSSGFTGIPGGLFTWNWDISKGAFKNHVKKSEIALFLSTTITDGNAQGFSLQHMSQTIVPFNSSANANDPNQPPLNASCRCVKDK